MQEKCRPLLDRLCDALGEDLNSPLCQELQEHLAQCPDCTLQLDSVRRTIEIYQSVPCQRCPEDVSQRLRARLNLPPLDNPPESL